MTNLCQGLDESLTYNTAGIVQILKLSRDVQRRWYDYLRDLTERDDYPDTVIAPAGNHYLIRGTDVIPTLRDAQPPHSDSAKKK